MLDFSKRETSENYKTSFDATLSNVRIELTELENQFNTVWNELETLRKERAALIESAIKILKSNNVKLNKQLCRCNNDELNIELESSLDKLGFKDLEEIKCSIVKINIRYEMIKRLQEKLILLSGKLSMMTHATYAQALSSSTEVNGVRDYDDEVVVDFTKIKKAKKDKLKEKILPEANLEEVVSVKKASPEIIASLNDALAERSNDVELPEVNKEHNSDIDSIIDESDLGTITYESDLDSSVQDIITTLEDSELTNETQEKVEETDEIMHMPFTIERNLTLKEIAERVYGYDYLWTEIYKYSSNEGIIDRIAAEHKISAEKVCTKPGYLNGVELLFPAELVITEATPVEEDTPKRRVA